MERQTRPASVLIEVYACRQDWASEGSAQDIRSQISRLLLRVSTSLPGILIQSDQRLALHAALSQSLSALSVATSLP